MVVRARRLLPVLVVGLLALTACTGPGGEAAAPVSTSSAASDEEQVTALLTRMATSNDPDSCSEIYTARALNEALGTTDLEACREAVAGVVPSDEAEVTDVVVDGDTATATLAHVGGDSGGLAQAVRLVREGGGWRFDGDTSLRIVDRAAVDARASENLQATGAALMPADRLACVDAGMRAATDAELEAVYAKGSGHAVLVDAIRDCVGSGVDLVAVLWLSSYQVQQRTGAPQGQSECIAALAIRGYGDLSLEQIVRSPSAREEWQQALVDAGVDGTEGPGQPICPAA